MDINLIKKLYNFYINCHLGFQFNGINKYTNYTLVYNNTIKDPLYNFITITNAKTNNEINSIIAEASNKMKLLNRATTISLFPFVEEIYDKKDLFFDNNKYELISNEIWQVYDNFDNLKNINTNCKYDVKLEKALNMKDYAEELFNAYKTGESDDPYGDLDISYKKAYANYSKNPNNEYTIDFFYVKIDDKIVGVTEGVYNDEIYGIYGLALKKDYRAKGIGKEIIRQQLNICKNKNLKLAFLQTEDGFYPADLYRKIGFKDVCNVYYYKVID